MRLHVRSTCKKNYKYVTCCSGRIQMKEYPHLILEKLFQRHFLFDNLTNYFPVNGFCLSKFPHYPVHKSDLYARSNMRRKRRRSSSFSPQSPTRSLKKDGEQSSERDAVLTNSFRKFQCLQNGNNISRNGNFWRRIFFR